MPMKRKPHQEGLDPQNPGIPVTTRDLRDASKNFQKTQARAIQHGGVQPGPLAGKVPTPEVPQNLTGADSPVAAAPSSEPPQPPQRPPQSPSSGGNGQTPEPPIPATYNAGGAEEEQKHPLLEDLEINFGIEKLRCEEVLLGGYKWTFRPMRFEDYEWMSNNVRRSLITQESSEPSMSVASVAAVLAAVNGTPVYELFQVNTGIGRHIPDPLNPPPDIKFEAATYLLEWFREKVGMWELISKLDEQVDLLFEEQRSREYPLWDTLASPYRQRIVELKQALDSSTEPDGKPGDDASQQQESSPQMQEPFSSGTTPEQPTSFSTGTPEQSKTGSMG